jgi:hypothetical protein
LQDLLLQIDSAYATFAQQQRLIFAAGEVNAVFLMNFALDPVGGFAQVVDLVDGKVNPSR